MAFASTSPSPRGFLAPERTSGADARSIFAMSAGLPAKSSTPFLGFLHASSPHPSGSFPMPVAVGGYAARGMVNVSPSSSSALRADSYAGVSRPDSTPPTFQAPGSSRKAPRGRHAFGSSPSTTASAIGAIDGGALQQQPRISPPANQAMA